MSTINQREDRSRVDRDFQIGNGTEGKGLIYGGVLLHQHRFRVVDSGKVDQNRGDGYLIGGDIVEEIDARVLARRIGCRQAVVTNQLISRTFRRQTGESKVPGRVGHSLA